MANETVRIALDASYPYSDFKGWYDSLSDMDKADWVSIAKEPYRSESNGTLLTKKAIELYCLEMDIDYIPKNEEYLDTIYRRLISNLVIVSLMDKDMVIITSGKLSFLTDATFEITEKGKKYLKKPK